MKSLIILEGIASSGKTTLERMLHERLEGSAIISEGETLMPLIENKEPVKALEHLVGVLDALEEQSSEIFILDRFHFTHAFRTGVAFSFFSEIEKRIRDTYKPLVVFLRMDESVIAGRIEETAILRGSTWAKGKQGSQEEKVAYYKDQQRALAEFAQRSELPVRTVDTTDKDWERCLEEILGAMQKRKG